MPAANAPRADSSTDCWVDPDAAWAYIDAHPQPERPLQPAYPGPDELRAWWSRPPEPEPTAFPNVSHGSPELIAMLEDAAKAKRIARAEVEWVLLVLERYAQLAENRVWAIYTSLGKYCESARPVFNREGWLRERGWSAAP